VIIYSVSPLVRLNRLCRGGGGYDGWLKGFEVSTSFLARLVVLLFLLFLPLLISPAVLDYVDDLLAELPGVRLLVVVPLFKGLCVSALLASQVEFDVVPVGPSVRSLTNQPR
jgi:hypothetical protein